MKHLSFAFVFSFFLGLQPSFAQWQIINSGTTQNLIHGCCVSDSIAFIISSTGLVLKSTDQGTSWQVNANLAGVFTSICNAGPDTIYTGGNCIYRTTNQGSTWTLMTTHSYTITDLGFFSGGKGYEIVPGITTCTWEGGVNYFENDQVNMSVDGGVTWNSAFGPGSAGKFDFVNNHVLFMTGGYNQIMFHCYGPWINASQKTTNSGNSWNYFMQPADGGSLISFFSLDSGYYVRDQFLIYKTVDGGNTLTSSYTEIPQDGIHQTMFINNDNGYLLGDHHIYLTKSSGFAWDSDITTSDSLNYLFKSASNFLFGIGTNGLILKKHHINFPHQDTVFRIKLNSDNVNFGYTGVDSSVIKSLILTNTGTLSENLTLFVSGAYKIRFGTGLFTDSLQVLLTPMQDTTINIRFSPTQAKSYPDSLQITSVNINKTSVNLSGVGFYGLYSNIVKDTLICTDTLRIGADISVMDSAHLTICAGTHVIFLGNYSLNIDGVLNALGDSIHPVVFDPYNQSSTWAGITLNHQSTVDTSTLRYCTLSSGINITGGSVIIDHCSIHAGNFPFGAIMEQSFTGVNPCIIITNNKIFNNQSDGILFYDCINSKIINNEIFGNIHGIDGSTSHEIDLTGNLIHDNRGEGIYGFGTSMIKNNKIFRNGGGIFWEGSPLWIINNEIYNNETYLTGGISCGVGSIGVIAQNLIYNNTCDDGNGAGIEIAPDSYSDQPAYVLNNTVCNNRVLTGKGNDFYATSNSSYGISVLLYNNIFYNVSDSNNIKWFYAVDTAFNNNCIHQSDAATIGKHTITANPEFVVPTSTNGTMSDLGSYSWALKGNSPCINAGGPDYNYLLTDKDFIGNPRITDNKIDIGAYEYPFPFSINNIKSEIQYLIFPNPVEDQLHVLVNNNRKSQIIIYDLTSRMVIREEFTSSVSLNMASLNPGIYFYQLSDFKGIIHEGKLVKR